MNKEIKEQINFGQTIFKFELSDKLISTINNKADKELEKLEARVREYHILHFFPDVDENKEIENCFSEVLGKVSYDTKFKLSEIKLVSAWINDQRKNEYHGIHIHSGDIQVGFSTIIYLRTLEDYGEELQHPAGRDNLYNGKAVFISNGGGLFSYSTHMVIPKVGDFYIFPYDMRHLVYPFSSEGTRRSLSMNFDVYLEIDHGSLEMKRT
tara:strand:+ start:295 stop:924 length:630 start_codon:yes stop_codon:yes gene_type:complete